LDPVKLESVEIYLGNPTDLVPLPIHLQDAVVIGEILLGDCEHRFLLQDLNERLPECKQQRSFKVRLAGFSDSCRMLSAFKPKFPFALTLMQVAETRNREQTSEGAVRRTTGEWIDLVRDDCRVRIRPQRSRNLGSARFFHCDLPRTQRRTSRFKLVANFLPGQTSLC